MIQIETGHCQHHKIPPNLSPPTKGNHYIDFYDPRLVYSLWILYERSPNTRIFAQHCFWNSFISCIAVVNSILILLDILLYEYTTTILFSTIYRFCIVSYFWLLQWCCFEPLNIPVALTCTHGFLLGIDPAEELLVHRICIYPALVNTVCSF